MNYDTLQRAIAEAQRFIELAQNVGYYEYGGRPPKYINSPTKESASCKRASMDLTRTLADLRQGR